MNVFLKNTFHKGKVLVEGIAPFNNSKIWRILNIF